MNSIVNMVVGPSWKSSLIGLLGAVCVATVAYAQTRSEPLWYIVAIAIAALGRAAKDWDKSGTVTPPAP